MPKDAPVDPRGPRFSAWMTTIVLAVVLLTGWWRLLAAQTVLFAMCAFISLKLNPWGRLLLDANVLFKLDDHGLRDTITPLVGLEYGF